jgi:hypothetical protein
MNIIALSLVTALTMGFCSRTHPSEITSRDAIDYLNRELWNGRTPAAFQNAHLNRLEEDPFEGSSLPGLKLYVNKMKIVATNESLIASVGLKVRLHSPEFLQSMFGGGVAVLWTAPISHSSVTSVLAVFAQDVGTFPPNEIVTYFRGKRGLIVGVSQPVEISEPAKCKAIGEDRNDEYWRCCLDSMEPADLMSLNVLVNDAQKYLHNALRENLYP